MAAVYSVAGPHPLAARLASAVLAGILLPLLLYRLSRRVFPSVPPLTINHSPFTIHHLSALLAAIYAYFILYSAMVQTEALFICALLWSLERALAVEQALRRGETPHWPAWLGLGLSLGIAALLRQSILPWVVVLFLWLLWRALLAARAAAPTVRFPCFPSFPSFPFRPRSSGPGRPDHAGLHRALHRCATIASTATSCCSTPTPATPCTRPSIPCTAAAFRSTRPRRCPRTWSGWG